MMYTKEREMKLDLYILIREEEIARIGKIHICIYEHMDTHQHMNKLMMHAREKEQWIQPVIADGRLD